LDQEIAPGIVRSTIVEPGFTRDSVNKGILQGHTTEDSGNERMPVIVGGPSGREGTIMNELSGQMRIVNLEGRSLDKWKWSRVTVVWPDGSSEAFDASAVGPR